MSRATTRLQTLASPALQEARAGGMAELHVLREVRILMTGLCRLLLFVMFPESFDRRPYRGNRLSQPDRGEVE